MSIYCCGVDGGLTAVGFIKRRGNWKGVTNVLIMGTSPSFFFHFSPWPCMYVCVYVCMYLSVHEVRHPGAGPRVEQPVLPAAADLTLGGAQTQGRRKVKYE